MRSTRRATSQAPELPLSEKESVHETVANNHFIRRMRELRALGIHVEGWTVERGGYTHHYLRKRMSPMWAEKPELCGVVKDEGVPF